MSGGVCSKTVTQNNFKLKKKKKKERKDKREEENISLKNYNTKA